MISKLQATPQGIVSATYDSNGNHRYHAAEMQREIARQWRNNNAPLSERADAAFDWQQRLTKYPETLTRCTEWLLGGEYGHAPAYQARKIVIRSNRENAAARLGQMIASIEENCCGAGARKTYRELTPDQQAAATGFVLKAINEWVDAGGTWTRADGTPEG